MRVNQNEAACRVNVSNFVEESAGYMCLLPLWGEWVYRQQVIAGSTPLSLIYTLAFAIPSHVDRIIPHSRLNLCI